jgi:PAS domain S-box-containing protein
MAEGIVMTQEQDATLGGATRTYFTIKAPYRDERGRAIGVVGISRDITERKRAEETLRASERLFRAIFEGALDAMVLVDDDGRFTDVNPAACALFGLPRDQLPGKSAAEFAEPGFDVGRARAEYRRAGTGHGTFRLVRPDGTVRETEYTATAHVLPGRHFAVVRDVTERRRAEEALIQSERRFRRVLESSRDVIYQLNLSTLTYDYASPSVRDVLGYTLAEFDAGGLPLVVSLTHPEDLQRIEGHVARLMAHHPEDEIDPVIEYRMRVPGKGWRWMSDSRTVVREEGRPPLAIVGTVRDVTDKKVAEERLREAAEQLRDLSRRLIRAQEEERRHIARELHDEIGQVLGAVSINLQAVTGMCGAAARPRLEESIGIVDLAIQQVRNLSLDLRPAMLDDLGLVSTLRWYADRQAQRAGFTLHFAGTSSGAHLPAVVVTACYRVAQEAVSNVVRHAHARHVWLDYREHEEEVRLLIRDDGAGFDPAAIRRRVAHGESFGMLGMQERVELLGGRIDIASRPGQGTRIRIRIPVASPPSRGESGQGSPGR